MSPSDHRKIGRLVIFGIPLIILLGLAMPPMVVWTAGDEVLLKASAPAQEETESFVLLQYAIEHVPEPLFSDSLKAALAAEDASPPVKVFGQLDKQGMYHVLTGLTDRKPEHGLYLSGKLYNAERADTYTVDFGLSRFHLLETNEDPADGHWTARVNVKSGYGVVKEISNRMPDYPFPPWASYERGGGRIMGQRILCEVNNCTYWGAGNKCQADVIYVVSQHGKQAADSEETDCKTFKPED